MKKAVSPILRWQYQKLVQELLLLEGHLSDPNCPCESEGEACVRKHSLAVAALAEETSKMDQPRSVELDQIAEWAYDVVKSEEKKLCGKEGKPFDASEARTWRKKFEFVSLSCNVPQETDAAHAPAPAPPPLKLKVCRGLAHALDTHTHFLGQPPDPKTGDHAWHRDWVKLYGQALEVCGCGAEPPAPAKSVSLELTVAQNELDESRNHLLKAHRAFVSPIPDRFIGTPCQQIITEYLTSLQKAEKQGGKAADACYFQAEGRRPKPAPPGIALTRCEREHGLGEKLERCILDIAAKPKAQQPKNKYAVCRASVSVPVCGRSK